MLQDSTDYTNRIDVIMRILCLGAGAVGGYFGARLIEAGADVTFLVRPIRRKALDERGLRVESCYGNFEKPVRAVVSAELREPFDIVLLTCKAYDLQDAIATVSPAIGSQSAVLPVLNGIAHIETLNAVFGPGRVLGGAVKISATVDGGTIRHLNDWNFISFGEPDGSMSERVRALQSAFGEGPVVARAVPNIMQVMWDKFVHLATIAGMTGAMRANVGEIVRTQEGAALLMEFLERNAEIAAREGFPLDPAVMKEYRTMVSNAASPQAASMLRDIERGGEIEASHVIGHMLQKARTHGVDATLLRMVFAHLQAYEQRRATQRL